MSAKADLILKGATFFTGTELDESIDFIAIQGNRILAAGPESEAAGYTDEHTKTFEYTKDQMILPGIHDNHIHLIQSGMLVKFLDLSREPSEEAAAKTVSAFAKEHPDQNWIIGFGWSKFAFGKPPRKESLDALIPDHPVFLLDDESHSAWVNSKALAAAGIDENTPDPAFGKIQRDESGEATGFLYETALSLVGAVALQFTDEEVQELVDLYSRKAHSLGITSVTDMTPYLGLDLAFEEAYFKMCAEGSLKLRINAALDLFADLDEVLVKRARAEKEGGGFYRIPFLKQFIDGILDSHTGLMLADYEGCENDKGGPLLDLEKMRAAILDAHDKGLSVRLHACGDGAVREALDAYEAAIRTYGKKEDVHHQIEHIEVCSDEDVTRFGELGVIASVQPEHIVSGMPSFSDNTFPGLLGPDREEQTWRFRTLLDTGAVLAAGSDCPVVYGNPFVGIQCGIERLHPDGTPEGGWNPKEKIEVEELLRAFTSAAAYGEGLAGELGELKAGMLADIAVLDRNLCAIPSSEIQDTKVLLTILDGEIVYEG